jgi:uncharacterized paraquat-inducible protein A
MLKYLNLLLFILFPVSWIAPLMHAGFLPIFDLSEITILSGLQSLWASDLILAVIVTFFALFTPLLKTLATALVQFGYLSEKAQPMLGILSKFAMADVFLVALYITLMKGVGFGRIEIGWGLYLFTFCVIASLMIHLFSIRKTLFISLP